MKKILILSIHALPMDVISSYRVKAYCDHFFSHGIFPTLLTTNWEAGIDGRFGYNDGEENYIEEEYSTHRIIRLPNIRSKISKSRFHTFANLLKGNLDVELVPIYKLYKNFLFDHLEGYKYDLLLGVYTPHFHLKLVAEAGFKYNIPYVLDFRDLWGENRPAMRTYKPSISEKVQDMFVKYWWKRWIKNALFYTITSQPWLDILNKVAEKDKGFIIRNGIEKIHFDLSNNEKEIFRIVYFGTIYPEQNLSVFFEGFSKFFHEAHQKNMVIEFIGLKEKYREGIKEEIILGLPEGSVVFTPSMSKEELMNYCHHSSLFWYPAFQNIKGWFSAKLYDYMALGKEIMVCPGDKGEVDNVIVNTKSGVVLNTPGEVREFLKIKYKQFNMLGQSLFSPNPELLEEYTRASQVEKMSFLINSYLGRKGHAE